MSDNNEEYSNTNQNSDRRQADRRQGGDRRQADRRQNVDRRQSQSAAINLSTLIIVIISLLVLFVTVIIFTIVHFENKINSLREDITSEIQYPNSGITIEPINDINNM